MGLNLCLFVLPLSDFASLHALSQIKSSLFKLGFHTLSDCLPCYILLSLVELLYLGGAVVLNFFPPTLPMITVCLKLTLL